MFTIENYDVQETRRIARDEGKAEGIAEGIAEGKIEATVNLVEKLELSVSTAMSTLELPDEHRQKVIEELKRRNISYTEDD